ncbi:hypothetical protein FTO74_14265 [Granulicella sp. WH15]|uniref:hypothetical protein n=1 Tax=Granulicella sp. WH15 TaxID=2602070 RepID=UPI0013676394|nr:hypothetical protein [Granulicella sp. WH15]QHN04396.1 hypothetical protein FTO74_14265 [Granulicella sp. WH15]
MTTELLAPPTPTEVAVTVVTDMIHEEKTSTFDEKEFEKLCYQFALDKIVLESSKELAERSRDALQVFVDKYGYVPEDAEKTIRCQTRKYQASVTRPTSIEINDSRVEQFQRICRRGRIAALFPAIFTRNVYYTLTPGADKAIEDAKPSAKFKEAFHTLYALCFVPKPKSPSLTFVDFEAEKEKREAKEAEKKAKQEEKKAKQEEKRLAKKVGKASA